MKNTIRLKRNVSSITLGAALLLSFDIGAVEVNKKNNLFNDFIHDSHADLSLRNVFKNLSTEDYGQRSNQTAWGQGVTLDYQSGYLNNMLGVDASYYGVIKLAASDDFWGRSVLYNDHGHAKGFNKLGQLYMKARLGDEETYFHLYSGWQQIKKWGALNNSTRAIPSTYLGWRAEAGSGPLRLRGAYVTRYSDRDSPEKIHFVTADKKQINQIFTGELSYAQREYAARYFFGESHNYLQRHGLEIDWRPADLAEYRFGLSSQLYMNHGLQGWRSMSTGKRTFDDNAYHAALAVNWQAGRWKNKAGVSYTHARLSQGLGRFEWHLAKHSRGTFNSMADSWGNDYVGHREKMLAWTFGYAATPEIELGMVTNYGWGMKYQNRSIQRGETLVYSRWTPSAVKDLSIQLSGGPSWNYQSQNNQPKLTAEGKPMRAQNHSIELQVDYKFSLF
ncbi:OprD family outer membrane porin [Serratia sp. NPDC078593]|uniref:OprD family outer membrane porin n=1 Tax=unclassified Serratia (in: enterobacteria) TaxID=2647522 RepID=UPI0037D567CD